MKSCWSPKQHRPRRVEVHVCTTALHFSSGVLAKRASPPFILYTAGLPPRFVPLALSLFAPLFPLCIFAFSDRALPSPRPSPAIFLSAILLIPNRSHACLIPSCRFFISHHTKHPENGFLVKSRRTSNFCAPSTHVHTHLKLDVPPSIPKHIQPLHKGRHCAHLPSSFGLVYDSPCKTT